MQAITIQQLFGGSAYQNATELVLKKADLVAVGLTATENNRAEQLAVAILLQALRNFQGYLTDENGNIITDESNAAIGYDNRNLWELLEILHWGIYIPEDYINKLRNEFIIHSYTLYAD